MNPEATSGQPVSATTVVLVPAYNESAAIRTVVLEVRAMDPALRILVLDDCSIDDTAAIAEAAGAEVVRLPCHLGLGGCIQTGYRMVYEMGGRAAVRIDGDGQHNPADIPRLLERLQATGCEMVIGVRENGAHSTSTGLIRRLGIAFFKLLLRPILGRRVTDPTSGFVAVNRRALHAFSQSFPLEYPEIETLVVLQRRAFRFEEVPVRMRPRMGGRSSITAKRSIYFVVHVLLGVLVNILRLDAWRWLGKRRAAPRG
ncbi:MAG: glycosyltransferase family 2 protein [Bryobacteraceae bacterium]